MKLLFIQHLQKILIPDFAGSTTITIPYQETNTSEGSEFLDDAIRTHEQPFMYYEKNLNPAIRPGSDLKLKHQ